MSDPDHNSPGIEDRQALLEALLDEQSPRGALLAGALTTLLSVAIWVGLVLVFSGRVQLYAAFSGVLIGFAIRNWGRGVERRFALFGLTFTFLALVLGALLSECMIMTMHSRQHDFLAFVGDFLNPRYAFKLVSDNLSADGFLFWPMGLVLGYRQSRRKITRAMLSRLGAQR